MTFFIMKEGKKIPYTFTKEEYSEYVMVCGQIWGGLPLDLDWSRNTSLYIETLNNIKNCRHDT